MPSVETHQMHTEASTETQIHSIHTDTTQVSHTHMANFPQQLSHLINAHQLDKNLAPQSDFNIGYTGPQFLQYSNNLHLPFSILVL